MHLNGSWKWFFGLVATVALLVACGLVVIFHSFGPRRDVLKPKYDQIQIGWSAAQVIALCGQPDELQAQVGPSRIQEDDPLYKSLMNSKENKKTYVYTAFRGFVSWTDYLFEITDDIVTSKSTELVDG